MDPSPEALGLGTLVVLLAIVFLFGPTRRKPDGPIVELIEDLKHGRCPKCGAVHPEASRHGPTDFWTTFTCPECKHSVSAHLREPDDEDDTV